MRRSESLSRAHREDESASSGFNAHIRSGPITRRDPIHGVLTLCPHCLAPITTPDPETGESMHPTHWFYCTGRPGRKGSDHESDDGSRWLGIGANL